MCELKPLGSSEIHPRCSASVPPKRNASFRPPIVAALLAALLESYLLQAIACQLLDLAGATAGPDTSADGRGLSNVEHLKFASNAA